MPLPTRDVNFYLDPVIILVEGSLFRVPRCTLESQSNIFRDMFSLPTPPSESVPEGSSDENPIRLPGVKINEFRQLLKVLLTSSFCPQTNLPCTPDEWVSVIRLARMWEFEGIYTKAVRMLPYLSVKKGAAEKVALAFQYGIEEWIILGLNELARQTKPIGIDDVKILGGEVALKVAAVRESLVLAQPSNNDDSLSEGTSMYLSSGPRDVNGVDFTQTIGRIFGEEVMLKAAADHESSVLAQSRSNNDVSRSEGTSTYLSSGPQDVSGMDCTQTIGGPGTKNLSSPSRMKKKKK